MSDNDMAGMPAGWYRDPEGGRSQRFWDGIAWTSFVRDEGAASAPSGTAVPQPPVSSASSAAGWITPRARSVASAQKLVLYAIALYLATLVLRLGIAASGQAATGVGVTANGLVALIAVATLVMALVGVYRLAKALGYGMGVRVVCVVLVFVPLAGLIMLLALNSRATSLLRASGLRVGLLGARR